MATGQRLFVKITRDSLPQVKDKYPFIYLERGRLEIDDSSIKWIAADKNVVSLPVATLNALLLGPGTTVTHDPIKTAASTNCAVCWVGEDSLLFYAAGFLPTADTRNLKQQIELSADPKKSVEVARRMYARRFPGSELAGKNLKEMMGMEGHRVRSLYQQKAEEYKVGWNGRSFTPGKFGLSDITNQVLTAGMRRSTPSFVRPCTAWGIRRISALSIRVARCHLSMTWPIYTKRSCAST